MYVCACVQQGDLYSLGQLLVCVGLQSVEAVRPDLLHRSMEAFSSIYSPDLNHLVQYVQYIGTCAGMYGWDTRVCVCALYVCGCRTSVGDG